MDVGDQVAFLANLATIFGVSIILVGGSVKVLQFLRRVRIIVVSADKDDERK